MSSGQANAAIAEDKAHTLNATHETQTIATPIVIDRAAFNQGQNAQYEPHIGESEVMDSLVARGPHAVGVPFRKSKRACSTTEGGPMFTLTKTDIHGVCHQMPGSVAPTIANTKSGDNDPLAVQAISFQPGNLARRAGSDPSTEVFPTLSKDSGDQNPHVAIIAPCITASNDPSRSPQSSEVTQQVAAVHQATMAVRRLTPNECYRLQGFPDNWGNIPWKGKPEGQAPDGPQYKAAGNSMAVPCMFWIGSRIAAVDSTISPNA
jgi:site-specific DNA-cytosine methylase